MAINRNGLTDSIARWRECLPGGTSVQTWTEWGSVFKHATDWEFVVSVERREGSILKVVIRKWAVSVCVAIRWSVPPIHSAYRSKSGSSCCRVFQKTPVILSVPVPLWSSLAQFRSCSCSADELLPGWLTIMWESLFPNESPLHFFELPASAVFAFTEACPLCTKVFDLRPGFIYYHEKGLSC